MDSAFSDHRIAAIAPTERPIDEVMRLAPMLGWMLTIAGVGLFLLGGMRLASSRDDSSGIVAGATQLFGGALLAIFGVVGAQLIPSVDDVAATDVPPSTPTVEPAADHTTLWTAAAAIAVGAVALAAAVIVGRRVLRSRARRNAAAESVRAHWAKAAGILGAVDAEYAAYHADLADRLFTRPLLDDTNDPHTAAFLHAHTAAHAAAYESPPLDRALAEIAVSTARAARDAWDMASRHALAAGLQIQPRKRAKLTLARKLLDQALDPTITDGYRDNLLDRITALIAQAGAHRVPPVRALVVESVHRQLAAATPQRQLTPTSD